MEHLLTQISIMLVPALLAITAHELAHGLAADKLGDPTARLLGRLTLNPLRHLDPIGSIAVFFFGFGWGRPTPVNANNLRAPKTDMVWVSLSGPVANLLLAAASALLLRGMVWLGGEFFESSEFQLVVLEPLQKMVAFSLFVNVVFGLINLLPLPPLDGGKILTSVLPEKYSSVLIRFEPIGFLLVLFIVVYSPVWKMASPSIMYVVGQLYGGDFQSILDIHDLLFAGWR